MALLLKDGKFREAFGFNRLPAHFFKRRNTIREGSLSMPNLPIAALGFRVSKEHMDKPAVLGRYSLEERSWTLTKAAVLLKEAKEQGNFSELMRLPVTDPRHPYYYEWSWETALKVDKFSLTPWQRYLVWHCLAFRAYHEWDKLGLLHDDLFNSLNTESNPFIEDAFRRLPRVQLTERERRLSRAYDMTVRREKLEDEECTHPEDDVAYMVPYLQMSVDQHREAHDNLVDYYART
eukprot:NODE_3798_length_896_cov_227.325098_g3645_i0.p1 GENE.NODE_3798_length_896_cov_227.325098_g3645_i0~~NODE_3798_length_896_cov_227.325098_g3645_i0.p1  ORF type:complete len:235 (+),score=30.69 NODE_3798_length_896_cov_227.325098_g3645_i0:57-761(+)